jgi:hypothetical protein
VAGRGQHQPPGHGAAAQHEAQEGRQARRRRPRPHQVRIAPPRLRAPALLLRREGLAAARALHVPLPRGPRGAGPFSRWLRPSRPDACRRRPSPPLCEPVPHAPSLRPAGSSATSRPPTPTPRATAATPTPPPRRPAPVPAARPARTACRTANGSRCVPPRCWRATTRGSSRRRPRRRRRGDARRQVAGCAEGAVARRVRWLPCPLPRAATQKCVRPNRLHQTM